MCVAYGTLVPRDHVGSRRAPIADSAVCVPSMPSVFDVVRGKRSYSVCFPSSCTPGVSSSDTNVASVCEFALVDSHADSPADSLVDSRADSLADSLADSRADSIADLRADFRVDFRVDSLVDFRADFRADSRADFGADSRADFRAEFRTDSRTGFRDDLPDVARRTCVCRATDTYCDTYADTDTVSLPENRPVAVAVTPVNAMDTAFVHNDLYGQPVRSAGCVQVPAPVPTPEPIVSYPLSAPSAPPPRAYSPFTPSESDTELFVSDSEVELYATGYRRDESAIHATTAEGSFCRRSACRIDPVESRMRVIAVLALLELNTNRSVPHPALH